MAGLRIKHYKIRRRKNLLTAGPFRLAVLADLHNGALADEGGVLRAQVHRLKPDAVLCCGDMLTAKFGRVRSDRALSLLQDLTRHYPVYVVNGNHETRLARYSDAFPSEAASWFDACSQLGVHLLNNRSEKLCLGGTTVNICGYEAGMDCYDRIGRHLPDAREIFACLGNPPKDVYTIVLSHHPDCFPELAKWGADLVLSGHLHGGMVRLPYFGGVVGATLRPFPRYDLGKFRAENGCEMIVSAGLGDHTIPLRVNNPPELVILE